MSCSMDDGVGRRSRSGIDSVDMLRRGMGILHNVGSLSWNAEEANVLVGKRASKVDAAMFVGQWPVYGITRQFSTAGMQLEGLEKRLMAMIA